MSDNKEQNSETSAVPLHCLVMWVKVSLGIMAIVMLIALVISGFNRSVCLVGMPIWSLQLLSLLLPDHNNKS